MPKRKLGVVLRDSVATPQYILDALEDEFKVKWFDPCPLNPHFDSEKDVDGLKIPWSFYTFVNPPYSNVKPWVEKAKEEHRQGKTIVLLLKIDSICKDYFKKNCVGAELRFINHRVQFPNYKRPAMFSSVLVVFKAGCETNKYKIVDYRNSELKTLVFPNV